MPLQATSGAASYDAFGGGGAAVEPNYIESVFSTYLYTGNGATQTITNGIDLSTEGGLVWIKARDEALTHALFDTNRGIYELLASNTTDGNDNKNTSLTAFNTNGFTLGSAYEVNELAAPNKYVSWTFREQPKFFDIVTWTGDGTGNRSIPHLLNSTPAFIQAKRTDSSESWWNHHRSVTSPNANWWRNYGVLNSVNAFADWGDNSGLYQAPDANNLYIGSYYNTSGKTYVAYLFAHDAGGFGLTGTDNVISCGSFTTDGSGNATVSLGYEPQWFLFKRTDDTSNWRILDVMRGGSLTQSNPLIPNTSAAEGSFGSFWNPTATGFNIINQTASSTWIYIAIRRGPMKVPTTGTSVFAVNYGNNLVGAGTIINSSTLVDMFIQKGWSSGTGSFTQDRMRGPNNFLSASDTAAEATSGAWLLDQNTGVGYGVSRDQTQRIGWMFSRAPSFFDEVCYTGTGSATTQAHNLGVVPELIIIKNRSSTNSGVVYTSSGGTGFYLRLFDSSGDNGNTSTTGALWNNTSPTSSVFSIGTGNQVNGSTLTYVAYLFATCAGVSKVGSYTGTGATQTINCGFTGGARFVLIKKSTSTAPDRDWYVWDTARGMVSGTDPSLKLNTTAAEANANNVYTVSTGFQLVSSADYVNASGVTYIFLAIA
jgi:hypothetical protein